MIRAMALQTVEVGALDVERFEEVLGDERFDEIRDALRRVRKELEGRRIWNVNSTARGGGVAEMLVWLLAYARGAGVDARWAVITGNAPFFAVTKRIHNRLHGFAGDGGALGDEERAAYESALADEAVALREQVEPGDVVLLHDPQTAGLIPELAGRGAPVIWRCHVGAETVNDHVRSAWDFLRGYVQRADATVFSRDTYVWEGLDRERVELITPTIDAFAPKNQELDEATVAAILATAGIRGGADEGASPPCFTRMDGRPGEVTSRANTYEIAPLPPDARYVLQVSRWDALKDPAGVIAGFAEHVAPVTDAHLVYAGPDVAAVSDDPEGAQVLADARAQWEALPEDVRARIHLVLLPMEDADENAVIVNALQRAATVVVQKSLAEGFGLTVAEAMWKARPVVASAVGGIRDQVDDGVTGVLLADPTDLKAYGDAVRGLLEDPDRAARFGAAGRDHVKDHFLGTVSLLKYLELFERLLKL
jgi:trehalose synthase